MKRTLRFFGFVSAILAIIVVFILFSPAAAISGLSIKVIFSGYDLIFGTTKDVFTFGQSAGLTIAFMLLCLGVLIDVFVSLCEIFFPNLSPKFPVYAIAGSLVLITSGILFFCSPALISMSKFLSINIVLDQCFNFAGIVSTFAGALLGLRAIFQIIK